MTTEAPVAEAGLPPAAKRAKVEVGDASGSKQPVEGVVSPALLESAASLAEQYKSAQPYRHCVMTSVFDVELLKAVREEIINNINATYKETDLFKVFQTGECATQRAAASLFAVGGARAKKQLLGGLGPVA